MPIYRDWNNAIADHFARITPRGGAFYLAVDEDALNEIGSTAFPRPPQNAVADFERAVRAKCVAGKSVILPRANRDGEGGTPSYLAFLAAMSLAAYRMAPEGDIAEINYFTRLREILGLTGASGRPSGLFPPAPEERLWIALNRWALDNGWQPTAERGPEGQRKYINYPISQSLLRIGDKKKLDDAFRSAEHRLGRYADRERVGAWFFNNDSGISTRHITDLAKESASERFESIIDAVYGVYMSIDWNAARTTSFTRSRILSAGLYRDYDALRGTLDYLLYPRARGQNVRDASVEGDSGPQPLIQYSDGSFEPLWEVSPAGGLSCRVIGGGEISELRLPERNFWVLTRDRYDGGDEMFASRGSPQVGETFLLACRESVVEQMNILKEEGLVNWDGAPEVVAQHPGWVEFRECMVLSPSWSGVIPQIPDLFDELRPRSRASISLQGGLKAGGRDSWMEGFLPTLAATAFGTCQVRLSSVSNPDGEPTLDYAVAPNSAPIQLPQLGQGSYNLEVRINGNRAAMRSIKVVSWDSLMISVPSNQLGVAVGDSILRGALLSPSENSIVERG